MDPNECAVSWAAEPSEADLIAPFARPEHRCSLPADHIHHDVVVIDDPDGFRTTLGGHPVPHLCRCGRLLAVRDVEPAGQQ